MSDNLEKRVREIITHNENQIRNYFRLGSRYPLVTYGYMQDTTEAILEVIKDREDKWQQELMGKISDLEEELYHERQARKVKG